VVLATELSEQLLAEGLAREVVHAIQTQRKDGNYQYTDRIVVGLQTDDARLRDAVERFVSYIQNETLAARLVCEPLEGVEPVELKLGPARAKLYIQAVPA